MKKAKTISNIKKSQAKRFVEDSEIPAPIEPYPKTEEQKDKERAELDQIVDLEISQEDYDEGLENKF